MASGEAAGSPRAGWPDRRRDLAGWLLTPVLTLVAAPVVAGTVAALLLLSGRFDGPPDLCASVAYDNRCEEATLGMAGRHAAVFGGVWLLLWLVPWWRGLRVPRVLLAGVAVAVLVLVPLRMVD